MQFQPRKFFSSLVALLMLTVGCNLAVGKPAASIPDADLIQPADLAATLKNTSATQPLILQVGFRTLYDQSHIPGAEYAGAARDSDGLDTLRNRVAKLPKDAAIVIYCGCCPWSRCPNIAAAYDALHELGFSKFKVLYIADNFGSDWVDKGYPATAGS
jgi:thiosulfate/3-mercaptopyruvate sulfurtransferase